MDIPSSTFEQPQQASVACAAAIAEQETVTGATAEQGGDQANGRSSYDLTSCASPRRCSAVDFSWIREQIAFPDSERDFAREELNRRAVEGDWAGRFSTTKVRKVILAAYPGP